MMTRIYGRKYVIRWDDEVGRYHATLGHESIGYHKSQDGARNLCSEHARQVALPGGTRQFAVTIESTEASASTNPPHD